MTYFTWSTVQARNCGGLAALMADAITPILASSIPRTVNKVQKKTIETNLHGFCNKCSFYLRSQDFTYFFIIY